ncbi:Uncharacterised protein [uncultured archaeon]|nr:Uncharacterised protein [uncultured archaeon]
MTRAELRLLTLAALAFLVLGAGCAQYRADLNQHFEGNGTSVLKASERFSIRPELVQDYITQMGGNNSADSRWLLQSIVAYYNQGAYARAICRRAPGADLCIAGANGSLSWQTTLTPDGRFYTWSSSTDWLNLKQTTTYQISHLPLIHYEVYQQKSNNDIAAMEWSDLRASLVQDMQAWAEAGQPLSNDTQAFLQPDSPFVGAMEQYAPTRVPAQIVDFEGNSLRGHTMQAPSISDPAGAGLLAEMTYQADFPDPVVSASMGGQPVSVNGSRIRLAFNATESPPGGRIVVVTAREFSPLGAYTWLIPIFGILITIARDYLVGDKRLWKEDEDDE